MKLSHFQMTRRCVLLAAALALAGAGAQAQGYPAKPIRLLVGYSAGGGVDTMARVLAPRLSTLLGQQVVVENRAGAAGLRLPPRVRTLLEQPCFVPGSEEDVFH